MTSGTADDPGATATYRVLKAVVIILGVLIVLAFAALVVGGIMKFAGKHSAAAVASSPAMVSTLPSGAHITSLETNGDRIVVGVHSPSGDEVDVFDSETGRLVARIRPQHDPSR